MPFSPELPPWEVFQRLVLEGERLAVVQVELLGEVRAYWALSLAVDALGAPAPKADSQDRLCTRRVECTSTPWRIRPLFSHLAFAVHL